ncbi:UNVERIFIED_CONTAM: Exosome component 5 [Siphonaria sp. JEL0065]|nr:Exosome component 5 [Siphonaria sp. JEL0065]
MTQGPLNLRGLSTSLSLLSRADGSARFGFGDTRAIAGVFGPVEDLKGKEQLEAARVAVTVAALSGAESPSERRTEENLSRILSAVVDTTRFPRTLIKVSLQPTSDDAGLFAAEVNASVLALVDAGLPLRALVAAVQVASDLNGNLFLDPTAKQLEAATSTHTFVFDNADDSVLIDVLSEGVYSEKLFKDARTVAKEACKAIHAFYRQALEQKLLQ